MQSFVLHANSSDIFNFSLSKAITILEEHFLKDQVFESRTETAIIACYAVLMGAGLCSNLVVCCVVLSNTRIRCSRNVLVINLNISDIILSVFCMPFTLLVLIRRSWFFGEFLCKLVPFVQASTVFVSAATVLAIAIDRYNVVVSFNPHRPKSGNRQMIMYTTAIWFFSFFLSLPMCIFQGITPVGLPKLHMYYKCVEQWPSPYSKGAYTVLTVIVQFVIPALVLLITHVYIKSHINSRTFHSDKSDLTNSALLSSERLKRDLQRNTRATMVLMNISVVFTFSWLPWNSLNLLADFHPSLLHPRDLYLAFAICHMTAMSSAITNPILYGWLNSNIRREIVKMSWVMTKVSSVLMSYRSSHSDNLAGHHDNTYIRSSGGDSSLAKKDYPECHV